MRRLLVPVLMVVLGCYRDAATPAAPTPAPSPPAAQALAQGEPSAPGCARVVRLRAARPDAVAETLRRHALVTTDLRAIEIPAQQGSASDIVLTVTVDGKPVTGIVETYSGTCVRSWRKFALDQSGNVWKLEPPSGVVDYNGQRCLTESGWVPCDVSGTSTVMFVLPAGKTFSGVVNPETGLRIELAPVP